MDDKSSHFEIEETYESELGEIDDRDTTDGTGALSTNSNPSYHDALRLLTYPQYHLVDAYPLLCQVYSIALAIPISSCTAEISFSVLKRVKPQLRPMMLQERLEFLLLMAIEKQIVTSLDIERIIDVFGRSFQELSRALIL